MPTSLPIAKPIEAKASASGTLATIAALLAMVLLSYTTLKQGDSGMPANSPQLQGS